MATNYFLNQYFTTTLNVGGGIDASQTTGIIVQAVSGLDITKPGIACITYADPINTSTAEWVTYTSIDGSNELQGVTRGTEGFGAKTHSNGAVIAFPISESHINPLATALSIGGVATNGVTTTLDEADMASNSATALATQQSIKAYNDSAIQTASDGATVTFDLGSGAYRKHNVVLGGNRTLALSNALTGMAFIISLTQDGTGSRTVTWFSTIRWAGGSAPTLTTTLNKRDTFGFICTGTNTYDGYIVGQNL